MISRALGRSTHVVLLCALAAPVVGLGTVHGQAPETRASLMAASEQAPRVPLRAARTADSQPQIKPSDPAQRMRELKSAQNQVESSDPAAIQEGFDALASLGGRDAAEIVIARLAHGLPPQLIDSGLTALSTLKQTVALPILLELATHRRWQVREHALDTLHELGAKNAQSVLLYALDDPNQQVREASARALAKLGDVRARAALLAAHERGVSSALAALASVGTAKDAEIVLARAQAGEWSRAQPALSVVLARPNLLLATKLKIISGLTAMGTPESRACLAALRSELTPQSDARIRGALDKALAVQGAPGVAISQAPVVKGGK